ncbi:glycosyltransferase [Jannaschia sp. R86511]|uniref:glycosyltransferase n=1 Tax=Jannaschia sp. R86511 TaxID=3093853 RepID=UPI0036D3F81C
MKVTVAHDYLTQRGGAERVALALLDAFPGAPLVTSVHNPGATFPDFASADVRTGPLQRWHLVRRDPRVGLALLPAAWDRTEVPAADVVVASTSGFAHGVRIPDDTALVAYCHNPARWLYQTEDYLPRRRERAALAAVRKGLEAWDRRSAARVDTYLANSTTVAARIERVYGIEAEVVHPPVYIDVDSHQEPVAGLEPGFWLTVARGRGYKNTRAVLDGTALAGGQVAVVGQQPSGEPDDPRVRWLGVVSDAELRWLYANARALVSVSREDFGLTPIEANAFGTPVAVLRAGGFLDSTAEGVSGVFVEEGTAGAVAATLRDFPDLDPALVREHAARFGQDRFAHRVREVAEQALARRRSGALVLG